MKEKTGHMRLHDGHQGRREFKHIQHIKPINRHTLATCGSMTATKAGVNSNAVAAPRVAAANEAPNQPGRTGRDDVADDDAI
jgi:hypothetical protein